MQDATAVETRNTEALRIGNFLQDDLCAAALAFISFNSTKNISLDNVVAEHDADWTTGSEVFYERECVGDPTFAFLVSVVEMFETERFPVTEEAQELARGAATCDNHDVSDTRIHEGLNRVIDHRLVIDWQQMFVCDRGEWTQSRPQTTS